MGPCTLKGKGVKYTKYNICINWLATCIHFTCCKVMESTYFFTVKLVVKLRSQTKRSQYLKVHTEVRIQLGYDNRFVWKNLNKHNIGVIINVHVSMNMWVSYPNNTR